MFTCMYLCQMLSNYSTDIQVFRYDRKTKTVFILAHNNRQEELEIIVFFNGAWRFIDDETEL